MAPDKKPPPVQQVMERCTLYEGRADGDRVVDSDPDGSRVVHEVNRTQRRVDALYRAGALTDEQYLAAELYRDRWEKARLVAGCKSAALEKVERSETGFWAARVWKKHIECQNRLGPGKSLILQAIVLHDESPAHAVKRYAKPWKRLESALDALVVLGRQGYLDMPEENA